jgi:protein TonB
MSEPAIDKKNKLKALIGTLIFHGALILLFVLVIFHTPNPPMFADNAGVEVNLGFSDEGTGDIQPEKPVAADAKSAKPTSTEAKKVTPTEEPKVITQTIEDAPVISKQIEKPKVEPVKQPIKEAVKEVIPQPVVNTAAMYKGKKNTAANSGGEGVTGKPGDQGIKEGSMYSKVHGTTMGTGDHGNGDGKDGNGRGGKGISFSLRGRNMIAKPLIDDNSQETGNVVVAITVDKNGRVTKATPGMRGSTTSNPTLFSKAKEAALKARFDVNDDAPEEQSGTITFVFLVQ